MKSLFHPTNHTQVPDRVRAVVFGLSLALLAWSLAAKSDDTAQAIAPDSARASASAAIAAGGDADNLSRSLVAGLEKRYPGARIEIAPSIRWTRGHPPDRTDSVELFEESGNGDVRLRAVGESFDPDTQAPAPARAEGYASFSAFMPAWIASRRVFPGERLEANAFTSQEVNVASGSYRDYRGLILTSTADALQSLQTRQTVLEGGLLLSNAVERVPDVRRGDAIRINLVSGGLVLTVPGVAQEPAYLDGRVRVITDRTKRELVGELAPGGVVEVKL